MNKIGRNSSHKIRVRQIRNGNFFKKLQTNIKKYMHFAKVRDTSKVRLQLFSLKIFFQFRDKFYFYHNDKKHDYWWIFDNPTII